MATAETINLQQIDTARTQMRERFKQAHEFLTREEDKLLRELEAIHDDFVALSQSIPQEFSELEAIHDDWGKTSSHPNMNLQTMNALNDDNQLIKALANINHEMEEILNLSSVTARNIIFQGNTDRNLKHAGKFISPPPANLNPIIPQSTNLSSISPQSTNLSSISPHPIPAHNYKPIIACCKQGTAPGELNFPQGLAVESLSGRIYIADASNNRVQVFTPNGEYCFLFSGNMHGPWGICINKDTVYVSQLRGDCITAYMLNGTYVNMVGSWGTMIGQFKLPRGLAVSPTTGLLYVCDCSNHRVQLFNKELKFHSLFAEKLVSYPCDVKLTQHLVIVLDRGDLCIHLFTIADLSLLRSIIMSKGVNIYRAEFFTVDRERNILLTDSYKHCVCVFNQSGLLIAHFGKEGHSAGELYKPTGISTDNQDRIVVVSRNSVNALQLFKL